MGNHIKAKGDEVQARLKRYKEKFKKSQNECTLLRKKANALDQLLRLSDREINQLQFDKKASHVRENLLSDLIEKMNGENVDSLYKSYDLLLSEKENKINNNNDEKQQCLDSNFMKERICDLLVECNHYKEILRLSDQNNMDLKQQTALYTHQVLENWQKIFDKMTSILNIKPYAIEILQKTVNDIIEHNKNYKDTDFEKENKELTKNINSMK